MANKLPKPILHAKCGVCFTNLTWSVELNTFECTSCLTKVQLLPDGVFKTTYSSPLSVPCGQPPVESYARIRHLREKTDGKRYFSIYTYMFYPCSLPKSHASPHYFHHTCRHTEETLDSIEYKSEDIRPD